MKIMIVTPYFAPKIGGLENYALNIAKGLQEQGSDVFVVTSNHEGKERVEKTIEGLRVICLPISIKLSNTPIGWRWRTNLKKIIREEKPDVINAHSPVPFMADMAFSARGQTPFVITYHSGSLKKGGGPIDTALGIYEKTFLKRMLKKSDQIISVYPAFIESLIGKSEKIKFIPPSVDTSVYKPSSTKKEKNLILYVGRIERSSSWKGIDILLEAFKKASLVKPDLKLQLVGDGDALDDYKAMAEELGIAKNITFSGLYRGSKLVDAYRKASILILPSTTDSEAFGMVLVEAMACGTPVIGSRIGGIPNVISNNKTGLLFKVADSTKLSDSIIRLLNDTKLYKKLATNGRLEVVNRYESKVSISKTAALLRGIL